MLIKISGPIRPKINQAVLIAALCFLSVFLGCSDNNQSYRRFMPVVEFSPLVPSAPQPSDNSVDQDVNGNLSWQCDNIDGGNLTFDLYFGETPDPPLMLSGIEPPDVEIRDEQGGILNYATVYYWRVVAIDNYGRRVSGPIWSFRTSGGFIPIGTYSGIGDGKIIANGNYLYNVSSGAGLTVLDISNLNQPYLISTMSAAIGNDFCLNGNYIYLASASDGLMIVDIANPAASWQVGACLVGGAGKSVAVCGEYAYLAVGRDSLDIINISNPSSPTAVGLYRGLSALSFAVVDSPYIYLGSSTTVQRLDISDPLHPVLKGAYNLHLDLTVIAASGDLVLLNDEHYGLFIIRFGDDNGAEELAHMLSYHLYDIEIAGGYAYITSGSYLNAIDLADPNHPHEVAETYNYSYSKEISVMGDYVFAAGDSVLTVYRHIK